MKTHSLRVVIIQQQIGVKNSVIKTFVDVLSEYFRYIRIRKIAIDFIRRKDFLESFILPKIFEIPPKKIMDIFS